MIITRIIGGLGNQMFQYAIAFAFAKKNNTVPKVDIRDHENHYTLHGYGLENLSISGSPASIEDIKPFDYGTEGLLSKVTRFIKKLFGSHHYLVEKELQNTNNLMGRKGDIFLDGFWQSEKYFKDHREDLLREFKVKGSLNEASLQAKGKIESSNAVSIHIRRGDYASDPETRNVHGLCPMEYYMRAIEHIKQHITDPVFYLFSDDPKWAKTNLSLDNVELIDFNNAETAHFDLSLMAACKHNIIANSTFSWWGAWLNQNPEKIVIAPEKWFADSNRNSDDIIPESWLKL